MRMISSTQSSDTASGTSYDVSYRHIRWAIRRFILDRMTFQAPGRLCNMVRGGHS